MLRAITTSDNTANDKLMRAVGGPAAVRAMIARKHLGPIRFADGERAMQSRIAGLTWSQDYALNGKFFEVRDALPIEVRSAAFNRYIADPYDGAAPAAIVGALARLKRGELLSPGSTAHLLDVMSHTHTGANRLKGGLQPGWTLNHKTGTGQELGGVQAGYNDVGILTAPDGKSYAVAVMIKTNSTPLPVRMTLMNDVVAAVIAQHDRANGGSFGSKARADPATRLAVAAGVQRVPTRELELFILKNFLDPATCTALVERIDQRRRPSEIADDIGVADFRTSETCDLDWHDPVVGAVDAKIAELLGLSLTSSEPLQGQRYAPGTGVQAAHRYVRTGRLRLLHPHRRDRAAHLDGNDLPERARRRRRDAVQDHRQDGSAGNRQAARLEQPACRRAAQPGDSAPRDEGAPRDQICPHQMVSRAGRLSAD